MTQFLIFVVFALLVWLIKTSSNGGKPDRTWSELTSRVCLLV